MLLNRERSKLAPRAETILLVEDEAELRKVVAECLRESGHQVLEACDGQHGLQMAEQYRGNIDLLLTDVLMPRMDGKQLGREFKIRPHSARMYMSAYRQEKEEVEAGAIFLRKPFRTHMLLSSVTQAFAAPRLMFQ